jgi:hypothetical protein
MRLSTRVVLWLTIAAQFSPHKGVLGQEISQQDTEKSIQALSDQSPMVRIRAVLDLANRGVKTEQAAAALAGVVMRDENANVHEVASAVLYSMPEQAKAMLPLMVATLRDTTRSTDQRSRAAEVIRDMRVEAVQAVFPVLDIVQQRGNKVSLRSSAIRALAAIGGNRISPAVATLTQILSDAKEDTGLRRDAADALGEGGVDADSAIAALSSVLKNERKETQRNRQELALRESAATAIGKISSQTGLASEIDGLIEALANTKEDLDLRLVAAAALQRFPDRGVPTIVALLPIVTNRKETLELRIEAVKVLGPAVQVGLIPANTLVSILKDKKDPDLRIKTAAVLGPNAKDRDSQAVLTALLADRNEVPGLREQIVFSVQPTGESAQHIVPLLLKILSDPKEKDIELQRHTAQVVGGAELSEKDASQLLKVLQRPHGDAELRAQLAYAMGRLGPRATRAVPTLSRIVSNPKEDIRVRRQACWALLATRQNAKGVIAALLPLVRDRSTDLQMRRTSASAIAAIVSERSAVDRDVAAASSSILTDPKEDPQVRQTLTQNLAQAMTFVDAVNVLNQVATDRLEDPTVRNAAIGALGTRARNLGDAKASRALIAVVLDDSQQLNVRQNAAGAAERAGLETAMELESLVGLIENSQQDTQLRSAVARVLATANEGADAVAAVLASLAQNKNEKPEVRASSLEALGQKGAYAVRYFDVLFDGLSEQSLQYSAATGLANLAASLSDEGNSGSTEQLQKALLAVRKNPQLAQRQGMDGVRLDAKIERAINSLQKRAPATKTSPWWKQHWRWLLVPCLWISLISILLVLFWLWPLHLVKLYHWTGAREASTASGLPVAVRVVSAALLPTLAKQPRALNAWATQHLQKYYERFDSEDTVRHSSQYIPLPLNRERGVAKELIKEPTAGDIRAELARNRSVLQLIGEGGAGKTTLAVQIGRWAIEGNGSHPILPLLIEEDTKDLLGVIRRKLQGWSGEDLNADFVKALLERGFLLPIIDRLSERSAETQEYVRTIHGSISVGVMAVTTRRPINFEGGDQVRLYLQPLKEENIAHFITGLLTLLPPPSPFPNLSSNAEFLGRFATVIRLGEKEVDVTPLLVKLYVDRAVEAKRAGASLDDLPRSIPELHFAYLQRVNPQDLAAANRLSDEDMLRAAEPLGRLSLGEDLVPREFLKSAARTTLSALGWDDPSKLDPIARLIENGVLREATAGTDNLLRFTLDPTAEFLTAFALAKECGTDIVKWKARLVVS